MPAINHGSPKKDGKSKAPQSFIRNSPSVFISISCGPTTIEELGATSLHPTEFGGKFPASQWHDYHKVAFIKLVWLYQIIISIISIISHVYPSLSMVIHIFPCLSIYLSHIQWVNPIYHPAITPSGLWCGRVHEETRQLLRQVRGSRRSQRSQVVRVAYLHYMRVYIYIFLYNVILSM